MADDGHLAAERARIRAYRATDEGRAAKRAADARYRAKRKAETAVVAPVAPSEPPEKPARDRRAALEELRVQQAQLSTHHPRALTADERLWDSKGPDPEPEEPLESRSDGLPRSQWPDGLTRPGARTASTPEVMPDPTNPRHWHGDRSVHEHPWTQGDEHSHGGDLNHPAEPDLSEVAVVRVEPPEYVDAHLRERPRKRDEMPFVTGYRQRYLEAQLEAEIGPGIDLLGRKPDEIPIEERWHYAQSKRRKAEHAQREAERLMRDRAEGARQEQQA